MGGLEERLDILLHRDTADVQLHRSRQSRQGRVPGNARSKMLNIDPASPRLRMAEAMDFQLCGHRFRGHKNGRGRIVAPAYVAQAITLRQFGARDRKSTSLNSSH